MCTPACVFKPCDVFKNFDEVAKFACPALVVHGRLDDQVPCSHGVGLHALLGGGGGGVWGWKRLRKRLGELETSRAVLG